MHRHRYSHSVRAGGSVFPAESIDAARRVDDLLLTRIERVIIRAHFDLKIATQRGARLEDIPARAGHGNFSVLRMDGGFHSVLACVAK